MIGIRVDEENAVAGLAIAGLKDEVHITTSRGKSKQVKLKVCKSLGRATGGYNVQHVVKNEVITGLIRSVERITVPEAGEPSAAAEPVQMELAIETPGQERRGRQETGEESTSCRKICQTGQESVGSEEATRQGQEETGQSPLKSQRFNKDARRAGVNDPQSWWPHGYGEQNLYQLKVTLETETSTIDVRTYQIGSRTIELKQEPDEWGESFTFIVNGVPVFAKGADCIPTDSFPTRITDAHLEYLLQSATDAHMNMLRLSGGGLYESESFYNLCDRLGILVWQDFTLACGVYPEDDEFAENVRVEAIENVRRLRHRASLALWYATERTSLTMTLNFAVPPSELRMTGGISKPYEDVEIICGHLRFRVTIQAPGWPSDTMEV